MEARDTQQSTKASSSRSEKMHVQHSETAMQCRTISGISTAHSGLLAQTIGSTKRETALGRLSSHDKVIGKTSAAFINLPFPSISTSLSKDLLCAPVIYCAPHDAKDKSFLTKTSKLCFSNQCLSPQLPFFLALSGSSFEPLNGTSWKSYTPSGSVVPLGQTGEQAVVTGYLPAACQQLQFTFCTSIRDLCWAVLCWGCTC